MLFIQQRTINKAYLEGTWGQERQAREGPCACDFHGKYSLVMVKYEAMLKGEIEGRGRSRAVGVQAYPTKTHIVKPITRIIVS